MSRASSRFRAVALLAPLVALAAPLAAEPAAKVYRQGAPLELQGSYLATLAEQVAQLARGASYADRTPRPDGPGELQVVVDCEPPLALELHTAERRTVRVRRLELLAGAGGEESWPLLFAATDEGSWYLAKYDGALALDILCSPELERYAPAALRPSCRLAPARSEAPGGPPRPWS